MLTFLFVLVKTNQKIKRRVIKMISIQKRGKVYQYRFEVARVNGKRKWISKSGFKTKNAAFIAGK